MLRGRKKGFVLLAKTIACLALLFSSSLSTYEALPPTISQCSEFPTFPTKKTLWHRALSPQNSEVLSVLNNRPIAFDRSPTYQKMRQDAEPVLIQALDTARMLGFPRDVVDSLCNLGCFYYLGKDYSQADRQFADAIAVARLATPKGSPAIAPLLDYRGLALRSMAKYEAAEACYIEALQNRAAFYGFYNYDVVYSLMNLACCYFDWSTSHEIPPSRRQLLVEVGNDLLYQVDMLMNSNRDAVQEAYEKEMEYFQRAKEITDPELKWEYLKSMHYYIKQTEKLTQTVVLVNSKLRTDIAPSKRDLSHNPPVPRPLWSDLAANNNHEPQLPYMVSFARGVIQRGEEEKRQPRPRPGLATILGNWSIKVEKTAGGSDISFEHSRERVKNESFVDQDGFTVTDVQRETKKEDSLVKDVKIYLCYYHKVNNKKNGERNIFSHLKAFGTRLGLGWKDGGKFGTVHGWPANNGQARELVRNLDAMANAASFEVTRTDQKGDYAFHQVPKGKYVLYASSCTDKSCMVWLIPNPYIEVDRVNQFSYDFSEKTGIVIWEEGHKSTVETPQKFLYGSQFQTDLQKERERGSGGGGGGNSGGGGFGGNNPDGSGLIPPPPPNTPTPPELEQLLKGGPAN